MNTTLAHPRTGNIAVAGRLWNHRRMRKRVRIALMLLAAGVAVVLCWEFFWPHEPSYHGRSLSEWLAAYEQAGSMENAKPISDAIRAMGTNPFPFLLENLKHTESPLERTFDDLVLKVHWKMLDGIRCRIIWGNGDGRAMDSLLALRVLGSNAAPLCPELLKMTDNTNIDGNALNALLVIGPASLPTLEKACESERPLVRREAILYMQKLLYNPSSTLEFAWGSQAAPNAVGFGFSMSITERDVYGIIRLFDDTNVAVRRASAESIGQFALPPGSLMYSNALRSAVSPLLKSLHDEDPQVRVCAKEALKILHPDAVANAGTK